MFVSISIFAGPPDDDSQKDNNDEGVDDLEKTPNMAEYCQSVD